MKKFALLIMVLLTTISLSACGSKSNMEELSSIYNEFGDIYDEIDVLAGDMYSAWHYGIYEDDHSTSSLAWEVSLSSSDLTADACDLLLLDEFSYCVLCVIDSYKELGHYDDIRTSLDEIKDRIKAIETKDEEELDLIEQLEDYYSTLVNFLELAEDYDGSFSSLQGDIQDYRNDVKDIESGLDFDLE